MTDDHTYLIFGRVEAPVPSMFKTDPSSRGLFGVTCILQGVKNGRGATPTPSVCGTYIHICIQIWLASYEVSNEENRCKGEKRRKRGGGESLGRQEDDGRVGWRMKKEGEG